MADERIDRALRLPWYHSIELAPGRATDGLFDLRPYLDRYGLPERMDGMRALDVGTWDGFWAFEMERCGATVVGTDVNDEFKLDWPPRRARDSFSDEPRGTGFTLAKEILGSSVERIELNVYDATPERLGRFDLVFCGSVLIHLRDQLLALQRIAALCDGMFISAEEHDRLAGLVPVPLVRYRADHPDAPVFWRPSARTWRRMIWTAGFDRVEERGRFKLRSGKGFSVPHVVHHATKS
ncbi:MAG: class I SAM-dependent methyltransferase [Solirubrobacterales bacterium]